MDMPIPDNDRWYQVLFEESPSPMLLFDSASYAVLSANRSACRLYGYAASDWQALKITDIHATPHAKRCISHLISSNEPAVAADVVLDHLRKDKTVLKVSISCQRVAGHDGKVALLTVHDVTKRVELEALQACTEQDLNRVQHIARMGSWVKDFTTRQDRWSDQTYRNLGLAPRSVAPSYRAFLQRVHPDDRAQTDLAIRRARATRQPFSCTHRVVWPDGSMRYMESKGVMIFDGEGKPAQAMGTILDVTERCEMECELLRTQKDFVRAQDIAHVGTWAWDPIADRYDSLSDETYRVFGFLSGERPEAAVLRSRIHPEDSERVRRAREYSLVNPSIPYEVEFRIMNPVLGERIVHSMAEVQTDANGRAVRMVGFVQDITERKRAAQQIQALAYFDKATGLPNRTCLEQRIDELMRLAGMPDGRAALVVVYLSRFRDLAYTLGYGNADLLLEKAGRRVRETCPANAFAARISDAEFAVLLADTDVEAATCTASVLVAALQRPFEVAGISYELGARAGISLAPKHGKDSLSLTRKADVALYHAKRAGLAYAVYEEQNDPYQPQRLELVGAFRRAVNFGELRLFCQPKVDIRQEKVVGVEALVRWEHPSFGLVPPDQFVPLIEPTDLIHLLTEFMLKSSIQQGAEWQRAGYNIPLAVNLSPRNLSEPNLFINLKRMLADAEAPARLLGLELTESSLIRDPASSIAELRRLSEMGFRLFIDDFGTGYSSLSYLMSLPVHVIKIDHSFTMRMLESRQAATIVRSTIDLAHDLGMQVVAEGTASRPIWDQLRDLGCDEAQGSFISPPMPAAEFIPWLKRSGFDYADSRPGSPSVVAARH
ncbi:EAL and GGDEF domain-containing protein [Noviherbaspirillum denitrificans]|uniref:Diguanylate cyclase n=1 Tax=Noviherbaspirillum denitrificans TaxID=1968433 RepID=A0A254TDB5_9BURK|nr:GGDEF domain-containing phosphodiesterase [Noviherbaspirillum denitrificans]OWW20604.1 hypothetical protein AYR66_15025 [Noviherbaspirillum denitrificans]